MGILSFVGGITSTIGKTIEKAVVLPVGNAIGKTINKTTGVPFTPQTTALFDSGVGKAYTNALGAAALALPIAAIGPAAIGKAALTNPIKTAVVVVGGGALASSTKAQEVTSSQIANAPTNLNQFGNNIGEALQDPSLQNIEKIAKDNPILTSAAAAIAGYGIYKAISPALVAGSTASNTKAIQKSNSLQSEANKLTTLPAPLSPSSNSLPSGTQPSSVVSTGETPTPKKKKAKAKPKKKAKKKNKGKPRKKKAKAKPKKKAKKKNKGKPRKKKKSIKRKNTKK